MSAAFDHPEHHLMSLLVSLFDTSELRVLIRMNFADAVSHALPDDGASASAVAGAFSRLILQRGELAALWPALLTARPGRAPDIEAARDKIVRLVVVRGANESIDKDAPALTVCRCRRCGSPPEASRPCLGFAPNHDFTEFAGLMFCLQCGARPTEPPVNCTGARPVHRFVGAWHFPRCRRCGVLAGERTQCSGLAPQHEFPQP